MPGIGERYSAVPPLRILAVDDPIEDGISCEYFSPS